MLGRGLHTVEQIIGRLNLGRAALYGAASGAWFGLMFGLLFGLFSTAGLFLPLLAGLFVGAGSGALFGLVGYLFSQGQRDFTSIKTVAADEYAVLVEADAADEANRLIAF